MKVSLNARESVEIYPVCPTAEQYKNNLLNLCFGPFQVGRDHRPVPHLREVGEDAPRVASAHLGGLGPEENPVQKAPVAHAAGLFGVGGVEEETHGSQGVYSSEVRQAAGAGAVGPAVPFSDSSSRSASFATATTRSPSARSMSFTPIAARPVSLTSATARRMRMPCSVMTRRWS